ncbi:hypothetical protein KSP40_PGU000334 [Platanthera guangdongensis]|uniref:BEACH domain-containing protein C2 n=1 Tax=Platanthera guangdongensis TaxID=2320717 RepID=A0ABR2MZ72_9ASPA
MSLRHGVRADLHRVSRNVSYFYHHQKEEDLANSHTFVRVSGGEFIDTYPQLDDVHLLLIKGVVKVLRGSWDARRSEILPSSLHWLEKDLADGASHDDELLVPPMDLLWNLLMFSEALLKLRGWVPPPCHHAVCFSPPDLLGSASSSLFAQAALCPQRSARFGFIFPIRAFCDSFIRCSLLIAWCGLALCCSLLAAVSSCQADWSPSSTNHGYGLATMFVLSSLCSPSTTSLLKAASSPLPPTPLVLASEADENGQVSAAVMERFSAAAAAEPFESVRCAFVSYGSCISDLAMGWKKRSRMWYGVGLPFNTTFGGGASGWESWKSALEKDSSGKWIELPLVKKSVIMLQALLLDESGVGSGLGIGGGSGIGMGGMNALYHLLDSDQPFLCMLRMILLSMREDDNGEGDIFVRSTQMNDAISEGISYQSGHPKSRDHSDWLSKRKPRSALLWSVLGPLLNMPVSESKRQRVLVACCILYSEVWHAIGRNRKPIRKQYVEAILPPFVAVLRRWRPVLAGIHELTSFEVQNPLMADDPALSADALPLEAALAMISPGWSAAFASPPAALALAMIAAGASSGETAPPPRNTPYRRETSLFERKSARLHTFSSFQKPLETSTKSLHMPKDKAAAKAAALAAARDIERNAKIGSGRGLSAVAMATSAQRRSSSDIERSKRWSISEAMGAAWIECLQPFDSKSVSGRDLSALCYRYVALLVSSFALARNMQRVEVRLEFWDLDKTESSCRMRRFFKKNYKKFHYLRKAAHCEDNMQPKSLEASYDIGASVTIHIPSDTTIMTLEAMPTNKGNEEENQPGSIIVGDNIGNQHMLSTVDQSLNGAVLSRKSGASVDQNLVQPASGHAPWYAPSEANERIILELPSLMVRPLNVVCGTFQITSMRINFIVDARAADESVAESFAASFQDKEQSKDRSWSISSLCKIFCRRYLVRRSALEIFMADRSNYFFDFGSSEGRKNAYCAIIQANPPHLHNIFLTQELPEQILKKTQLMERWARWEISNFEYLMELNTLAGRSYNDITQYPIFPWVLADYYSKTLNIEDPSSYRDLSKPIGALNPDRLKKFQERYSSFDDPIIPKFHYGSHYSSAKTGDGARLALEEFSLEMEGGCSIKTKEVVRLAVGGSRRRRVVAGQKRPRKRLELVSFRWAAARSRTCIRLLGLRRNYRWLSDHVREGKELDLQGRVEKTTRYGGGLDRDDVGGDRRGRPRDGFA